MNTNNQTNNTIKWAIICVDFIVLNALFLIFAKYHDQLSHWRWEMKWAFLFANNLALLISELRFSTIVHQRVISSGDILRRVLGLVMCQTAVAYVLMKLMTLHVPAGRVLLMMAPPLFLLLIVMRFAERTLVKRMRSLGRNTRTITFVGNDPELFSLYKKLMTDPTTGYRVKGYYADDEMGCWTHTTTDDNPAADDTQSNPPADKSDEEIAPLERLGTLQELMQQIDRDDEQLHVSDELYVCLSRRDRDIIKRISRFCDKHVIRFYYLPVSVESIGISLRREMLDDLEVFTTYDIPLANPVNKFIKRTFDIVASLFFLIPTALMFPFIWIIIKIQSPGPIFFKQKRTGLDGKEFEMLKFRSMHVNKDADRLQATKDDPRKYPFGNFMRASNIDELPQFLNVLKGDMSFVGPRPHMLLHTEQYSKLIEKYMVRHFVKPGLTGWAQVTGFRGETKELWQMEGRVQRDIWYIENWSIWLDIRIIWLTVKTFFVHDKNAY